MDPGQDSWELELELRPTGALAATGDPNELVAKYERQLSAAQLVQQRLQQQCDQLVEEKASVEASLGVQIAALQQQLASVHAKAAEACTEAERAQQQVQYARAAVEQIVHSVTQLAEHLDEAGATPELTLSFESVAKSTQATYEAVSLALSTSEVVVGLGYETEKACMMDPILTSTGGALGGLPEVAGALRALQDDARRLTSELQASREREQQLDQELQAAQVLFTGLEAEVVGLQHEQAQAAAKLQLSHEELLHGRSQLLAAKRWLLEAEADGPAVDALSRGVAKLDAHMAAVREFLEGLSMPVPTPHDEAANAPLQDRNRVSAAKPVSSEHAEDGNGTDAAARPRAASGAGVFGNVSASGSNAAAAAAMLEELSAVKAERDDARQQLDMLAANISLLERRLEEVQVEKEQLEHQLGEVSQLAHAGGDAAAARTTQDGSSLDKPAARSRSQASATGMDAADGQGAASRRLPNTPGSPARRASRIPAPPAGASPSPSLAPPSDRVSESGSATRIPKPSPSRRLDGSKGGFALDQSAMSESVLSDVLEPLPSASLAHREHAQRVEQLSATVAALEQQVAELQSACKESTERAGVLQEEKEAAATLLQKLGDEQRLLAEQLRVLEVAKDDLEAERSQLVAERDRLQADCAQLTAALADAETRTEGHGEEQEELRADYARLAATLAEVRAHTDSLEGERDELQADCAELAATLAEVRARSDTLDGERIRLQADCAELAAALAGAQAHAKGLKGERESLQASCAELAAALADVKALAEGLEGEREQLQAEAAELADRARELRQENSALRGKVESLTQRISSLEAEQEQLVQQHEEAVSVAAAAGAAGAAAAVAVSRSAAPAPEGEGSYGDGGPGSLSAATAAAAAAAAVSLEASAEAAALRQRVADLESEVEHLEAAREAAAHRQALLESELAAMGELLQQATDGQEAALRQASSYVATAQRAAQLESEVEALNELLQQTCTKRDAAVQRAEELEAEMATAAEQHALDRQALEAELQAAKASSAAAASAMAAALRPGAVRGSLDGIPRGLAGQAPSPLLSGRGHLSAHNSLRLRSARASSGHMLDSDEHADLQVDSPLLPLMYNNLAAPSKMHTLEPVDPMDDLVLAAHRVSATAEDPAGGGTGSLWRSSSGRPLQLPGVEGVDPGTLSSRVSLVQPARQSDTAEEVAQLQAALCSLLVSKALATAQLQAEHEAELSMLQAAHEAELSRLQAECSAVLAPAARVSSRSLQVETAGDSPAATEEVSQAVTELQAQVAELEATVAELQALQEQLQAEHAAELVRASGDCDARLRQVQAEWEARLLEALEQVQSQLDEARARDVELQAEAALLRSQLEAAQGRSVEMQGRVEELQGLLCQQEQLQVVEAQLQGERARAAQLEGEAEQLRSQLADAQAILAELQSQVEELKRQLAQVQSDKEVEEQSLQSLLATKAWMTQEIRSLQSDLREAQQKLERTEAELAAAKAAAAAAGTASQRVLPTKAANPKSKGDAAASSRSLPAGSGAPPKVPADKGELGRITSMMQRASVSAAPGPGVGSRRATRASSDGGDGGSPTVQMQTGVGANSGMGVLSDQLAEAAMQAALAEAKLEQLQQQQQSQQPGPAASAQAAASPGGPAASLTGGMGMEHTDMMMETLVLHGEIDELKAKQATLQEQLGVMGDELAKAVLQASLAEALLEQARVRRPGRRPSTTAAAPRQGAAGIGCLLPQAEAPLLQQLLPPMGSMARFQRSPSVSPQQPSKPSPVARPPTAAAASPAAPADARTAAATASTPTGPVPEYPGTKAISPLEQTQQLKSELQVVARALNELFEGESPTGSRQTLSTLRPAVLTAIKLTDHVTSSLQQQQQLQQQQGKPIPQASAAAASRGNGAAPQPAELDRVRTAYRDAREVYDMLRSDAEDLNRRLWRWGSNLREQVTAMEQQITRVATAPWPGQEAAVREVVAHKDQYLRAAEAQIARLQGDLRSAQKRVLRRNQQLADLQHVLVQLSEQVSMFEGVVVRCEALSADLASQAVKAAA